MIYFVIAVIAIIAVGALSIYKIAKIAAEYRADAYSDDLASDTDKPIQRPQEQKLILNHLDLSTKEGIDAAPSVDFMYDGEFGFVLLNVAAKNHKKNGRFDLAELCYKKMSHVLYSTESGVHGGLIEEYWKDLYAQRRFNEADEEKRKMQLYLQRIDKKRANAEYSRIGNNVYYLKSPRSYCPKCFFMHGPWHDKHTPEYNIAIAGGISSPRNYVVGDTLYCDFCNRLLGVYVPRGDEQVEKCEEDLDELSKMGAKLINKNVCEKEYDFINRNMLEMKPQTLRKYMTMKHNQTEEYIAIRDTAESMGFKFYSWVDGWYQETYDELGLDKFFGANTYYTNS